MKKGIISTLIALLVVAVVGCTKAQSDQAAIRESILRHLSERGSLNLSAMEITVQQISLEGDRARALVEFRLRQGGAGMQMAYDLQRHAGTWVVARGQPAGGEINHPPLDQAHGGGAMGAGGVTFPTSQDFFPNPAAPPAGGSPELPPGHPPVRDP